MSEFLAGVARHTHIQFGARLRRSVVVASRSALRCLDFLSRVFDVIHGTMPRYHFHYRVGSSVVADDVGEVFADISLAKRHATTIARELACGGEPAGAVIVVTEAGHCLFEVSLTDHGDWSPAPTP